MAKKDEIPKYVTAEELFDSPEPSTSFEEARKAFLKETKDALPDPSELRYQEDWSFLANRVVGAEDLQAT